MRSVATALAALAFGAAMPAVAQEVTAQLSIPTIGIGAGAGCDGQVLVIHDMLGLNPGFQPRFLRHFGEIGTEVEKALGSYVQAVRGGEYPGPEHTFD